MAGYDVQIPNFAAAALGGFQAGQAMGKRNQVEAALAGVDLSRPETLTPLLRVDPEHGIALLGASTAMLKNEREIASREMTTNYLKARFSSKPAASITDPATAATPINGADPVSQAGPESGDAEAAWQALAAADPNQAMQLREAIDKMDEAQLKRLTDAQDALYETAVASRELPYPQRRAYIQQQTQNLVRHHVTPEQIAGFDPTDQNLDVVTAQVLGVKGAAEMRDKARARAEQERHNRTIEGQGASRIGIAQGALKVAQSRAGKSGASGGDLSSDDTAALLAAAGLGN